MAERAGLNLNMTELVTGGIQWAIRGLFHSFIVQIKRVLILATTVIVASVLLCTLWLVVQKADHSLSNARNEVGLTNTHKLSPHGIVRILKDLLQYAAIILSSYEPLSLQNLLRHRDQLNGVNYMLHGCFSEAIKGFNREPLLVQENSKMVIQCDGQTVHFLSGNGDCEISVYILYDRIQYDVRERTAEMYLARLSSRQEPLTTRDLLRIRSNLLSWGVLSEELEGCLEFAVQEYSKEPLCVQDNANMVIDCGGRVLKFASGSQDNAVNVYDSRDGTIHYQIKISSLWASTVRFFKGNKDHTQTRVMKRLLLE